jgi:hypothetical protein
MALNQAFMNSEEQDTEPTPKSPDNLRDTFVEMLFALTVAQIAINAGTIVSHPATLFEKLPAYSHLLLVLLLVAASWVGWSKSTSPGRTKQMQNMFSRPFIYLLLDVSLVILYFIIVQTLEGLDINKDIIPDAKSESQWLIWIFGVYVIWDLLTDIFVEKGIPVEATALSVFLASIVSVLASLICLIMVIIAYFLALRAGMVIDVVLLDLALISVVFLFRSLKGFENFLAPIFKVKNFKAFQKRRDVNEYEKKAGVICFLMYTSIVLFLYFFWTMV